MLRTHILLFLSQQHYFSGYKQLVLCFRYLRQNQFLLGFSFLHQAFDSVHGHQMPADKAGTHQCGQNCSLHFFLIDFVGIKLGRCDWRGICLVHLNGLFLKLLHGGVPSPVQHCCKTRASIQQIAWTLASRTSFMTTEITLSVNHVLIHYDQGVCVNEVEVACGKGFLCALATSCRVRHRLGAMEQVSPWVPEHVQCNQNIPLFWITFLHPPPCWCKQRLSQSCPEEEKVHSKHKQITSGSWQLILDVFFVFV